MALTEENAIDRITVRETGHVEVRRVDRILKDGVSVSETFHRHVLTPGDDLTDQAPRVQAIANAAWTPEVIAEQQARTDAGIRSAAIHAASVLLGVSSED